MLCSTLLNALVFMSCSILAAQLPITHQRTYWENDRQIITRPTSDIAAEVRTRTGKVVKRFPLPPHQATGTQITPFDYVDGALYGTKIGKSTTPEGPIRFMEIHVSSGGPWECWGRYEFKPKTTGYPSPFAILPNQNAVLACGDDPLWYDGRPFPFALLKRDSKDRLHIQFGMDTGLEKPCFTPQGQETYPGSWLTDDFFFAYAVRTADHITLFSRKTGYAWVFDASKGWLRGLTRLYSRVDERRLREGNLLPGLLAFQPRPDNTILVAARVEDAVLTAAQAFKAQLPPLPEGASEAPSEGWVHKAVQALRNTTSTQAASWPLVTWWCLDPATRSFKEEPTPPGAPTTLPTAQAIRDFNWIPTWDGRIRLSTWSERGKALERPKP